MPDLFTAMTRLRVRYPDGSEGEIDLLLDNEVTVPEGTEVIGSVEPDAWPIDNARNKAIVARFIKSFATDEVA